MANTYIKRTCDGAYTSTFTWSAWVKRSATGSFQGLFCNKKNDSNSNSRVRFYFSSADRLAMEVKDSTSGDDSFFQTNRLFRDVNAWYHIVLAYDTTESAENDRIKLWINNEEVTSWEQFNRAGSGFGTLWSSAMEHRIGTQNDNSNNQYYFDGSMSHVHLTYGTAYTPSAFGETDATTGEWKIKTSPSVTYGSQGYFVLKDGNSVTDQSGNSNNFTVGGGTLTKTEDNPSNVFCTLNPLTLQSNSITLSNGNTKATTSASAWRTTNSTIGVSSGKWYFECKAINTSASAYLILGIQSDNLINNATSYIGDTFYSYGYKFYSGQLVANENNGGGNTAWGSTISNNQIVGMAVDLTNSKLYFSINGTWQNSGDPTSGATGTGGFSIQSGETYFAGLGIGNNGANPTAELNFGNGYFGTTAVSSAGTNASGIGIFEYDVPTGYTALSTKGLNL